MGEVFRLSCGGYSGFTLRRVCGLVWVLEDGAKGVRMKVNIKSK